MNRTNIRNRAATAALRIARKAGVQMDFTPATGSAITGLWGFIESSNQISELRDGGTDVFAYVVVLPRQTSFPPSAFVPGDRVKYPTSTGILYGIDRVEPDNEDILQASTFRLYLGRHGQDAELD